MNANGNILIVEDDFATGELYQNFLEESSFTTSVVDHGAELFLVLGQQKVDLVILDLQLPDQHGLDIIKRLREEEKWVNLPVIVASCSDNFNEKLAALDQGADDFISKPIDLCELLSRVKAVLRRSVKDKFPENDLHFENLKLNLKEHKLTISEKPIALTYSEFSILALLLNQRNMTVCREEIAEKVLGSSLEFQCRSLDTHIKNLRKKLEAGDLTKVFIKTIYKVGYTLTTK